ncbi:cystathionine gamma-synthase [Kaistia algarum]|uniref:c-type cytochrome n=1 Tax=Kaistia algarum TaxID=2083279 RepID=UPI000CE87524|nr:c-type cytochrome [Kaistia algarum]MCX5511940.1 c-type cytochrome [Kaistia algarum]PPE80071.1 cystathionine gamma-synthase [Kaistia algarum]
MKWRTLAAMAFGAGAVIVFVGGLAYLGDEGLAPIDRLVAKVTGMQPRTAAHKDPALADDSAGGWFVPDIDKLPDDAWGRMVRKGRDQTVRTPSLLGPEATDPTMRFAGSNLTCQNCHLKAGTKKFGLPFIGVFASYPEYSARHGAVATMEDRVNSCMTRSLNGKPLPVDSEAMVAFISYFKFLSQGRPIGEPTLGRGAGSLPELTRAADPAAGAKVFAASCAACHGANGLGRRVGSVGDGQGYEFPPLWGPDSFNDGAGMARLTDAANFIYANMPNGATYEQPTLTSEQAWDVAAYLESMARPQLAGLDKDFPNRLQKPVDAAYGPYADGFPELQHKYGPFQPIRDKLMAMEKAEAAAKASPAAP